MQIIIINSISTSQSDRIIYPPIIHELLLKNPKIMKVILINKLYWRLYKNFQ